MSLPVEFGTKMSRFRPRDVPRGARVGPECPYPGKVGHFRLAGAREHADDDGEHWGRGAPQSLPVGRALATILSADSSASRWRRSWAAVKMILKRERPCGTAGQRTPGRCPGEADPVRDRDPEQAPRRCVVPQ